MPALRASPCPVSVSVVARARPTTGVDGRRGLPPHDRAGCCVHGAPSSSGVVCGACNKLLGVPRSDDDGGTYARVTTRLHASQRSAQTRTRLTRTSRSRLPRTRAVCVPHCTRGPNARGLAASHRLSAPYGTRRAAARAPLIRTASAHSHAAAPIRHNLIHRTLKRRPSRRPHVAWGTYAFGDSASRERARSAHMPDVPTASCDTHRHTPCPNSLTRATRAVAESHPANLGLTDCRHPVAARRPR